MFIASNCMMSGNVSFFQFFVFSVHLTALISVKSILSKSSRNPSTIHLHVCYLHKSHHSHSTLLATKQELYHVIPSPLCFHIPPHLWLHHLENKLFPLHSSLNEHLAAVPPSLLAVVMHYVTICPTAVYLTEVCVYRYTFVNIEGGHIYFLLEKQWKQVLRSSFIFIP